MKNLDDKPDNEQSIKKTLFPLREKNLIQYNIEIAKCPGNENEKNLLLIKVKAAFARGKFKY
jgi:hypothetical protein